MKRLHESLPHRLFCRRLAPALALGLLAPAFWPDCIEAQPRAVDEQVQANTYTTGNQDGPDIAVDAAGNFVVASLPGSRFRRYPGRR